MVFKLHILFIYFYNSNKILLKIIERSFYSYFVGSYSSKANLNSITDHRESFICDINSSQWFKLCFKTVGYFTATNKIDAFIFMSQ